MYQLLLLHEEQTKEICKSNTLLFMSIHLSGGVCLFTHVSVMVIWYTHVIMWELQMFTLTY